MKKYNKKLMLPIIIASFLIVSVSVFTIAGAAGPVFADEITQEDGNTDQEGLPSDETPADGGTDQTGDPSEGEANPEDSAADQDGENPGTEEQGSEESEDNGTGEDSENPGDTEDGENKEETENSEETEEPGNTENPENGTEEGAEGQESEDDGNTEENTEEFSEDENAFEGDDWATEDEEIIEEEEDTRQFAGESGTTDFATLPLLDLSAGELTICSFLEGKGLGKTQKAVILSYLMSYKEEDDTSIDDETAMILSAGLSVAEFENWCVKKGLEESELRNQLEYIYDRLLKETKEKGAANRFLSAFRSADQVKTATAILYAAAAEKNIRIPYSKFEIMNIIVPRAEQYLELFNLGGEQRKGTSKAAYYCQGNYANVPYDFGNVADSGCGITSFSMVLSEFTGLNFGPEVTATWANENGVNTVQSWGAYWWLAERFGVKFLGQYSGGFEEAVEALRDGNLVIASLHQDGFFTTSDAGHYILLTGVDEDGRIHVNDPASYERSLAGPFDYNKVFKGCIQYWIFGR